MNARALSRNRGAFTLIELLTVVAIIAVLTALALPAFKKAMASARRSTCMSNERQIGSGLFLYAADHDNQLPAVDRNYPSSSDSGLWNYAIWTYCGYSASSYVYNANDPCVRKGSNVSYKKNIFRCPEIWGTPSCPPGVQINPNRMSYGLNSGVGSPAWADVWTKPVSLGNVTNPAATAMVVEASFVLGTRSGFALYFGLIPHDAGLHVLFYDGHSQYMKYTEIPTLATDPFWNGQ